MKKVFVTGSNGFLGSWIVKSLLKKGYLVKALVRSKSRLDNLSNLSIEYAYGDILDRKAIENSLFDCNYIIHTAGIAHFKPNSSKEMFAVNVDGVINICESALKFNIDKIILTSSTAVMGGSNLPKIMDESSPSMAEERKIDYFVSKYRGERIGLSYQKRGLNISALRPVVLLGPGDIYNSSTTTFLDLAKGKLPVFVNGGAGFCDVREVATAHVTALEKSRSGEVYILGGHNKEIKDLLRLVSNMVGCKMPYEVPYNIAYFLADISEKIAKKMGIVPSLSRDLVKASSLFTYTSSQKAIEELDYSIRDLESSFLDTFRYFIETKRLKPYSSQLKNLAIEK